MHATRGPARVVGALVAVMMMVVGVAAAPAQAAGSTLLCRGFAACALAGRSDAGYQLVYRLSHWNMTPGHVCTNYVAYRLTHDRVVARPTQTGDADSWGAAARREGVPVSATPQVGDVAWWRSGYHGASPQGHVAYIEQVRGDGTVVVSEDNFDGTFVWRSIAPGGTSWPSGFIRFPESDGSPSGELVHVDSTSPGVVTFSGAASDPDAPAGPRDYLVSVGGPRDQAGVETFTFSTEYFRFSRTKTLRTTGASTLYLYALNAAGTAGSDTLLGSSPYWLKRSTAVSASFVDATIPRSERPRLRVAAGAVGARGTVEVMRGSTRIASVAITSDVRRTVALPRQPRGRFTITVTYLGSDTHARSSTTRTLTVR